jgi:hypothetical protein
MRRLGSALLSAAQIVAFLAWILLASAIFVFAFMGGGFFALTFSIFLVLVAIVAFRPRRIGQ